jgi:hypothetical protein
VLVLVSVFFALMSLAIFDVLSAIALQIPCGGLFKKVLFKNKCTVAQF